MVVEIRDIIMGGINPESLIRRQPVLRHADSIRGKGLLGALPILFESVVLNCRWRHGADSIDSCHIGRLFINRGAKLQIFLFLLKYSFSGHWFSGYYD